MATPDGGLATFSYSGGLLSTITEPGNRVVTMTYTSGDLTTITDPTGLTRGPGYSSHRVTGEGWGGLSMSFTFNSTTGHLTSWKWNADQYNITPEAAMALTTSPALNFNQAVAVITDPTSFKTTYTLDSLGRTTKLQLADITTETWQLNSAGFTQSNPPLATAPRRRSATCSYRSLFLTRHGRSRSLCRPSQPGWR